MDALQTVIDTLPEQGGPIRRLYWQDVRFRAVCEDYRETLGVLDRLERMTPPPAARLGEYRALAAEFLAEAREMLVRAPAECDGQD